MGPRPLGVVGELTVVRGSDARVNLASLFTRPALGMLTYGATSSDEAIATVTVAENTPARRAIQHPVRATDPDGHRVTYHLSGPDSASFSVDVGSGQLRTLSGITYDFEDNDRYSVDLEGSDPYGESATIGVTIHVADVK